MVKCYEERQCQQPSLYCFDTQNCDYTSESEEKRVFIKLSETTMHTIKNVFRTPFVFKYNYIGKCTHSS